MLDPHRKIQALIDRFVAELGDIAKQIALEQLKIAFGSVKLAPLPRSYSSSASSSSSSSSSSASSSSSSSSSSAGSGSSAARRSRARRGQHEIEALRNKLLTVISDNPGCRAEEINGALGTRTPQIAQPLRKLVADRLVRTEGARRGTRYFAVGASDAQNGRRPAAEAAASTGGRRPAAEAAAGAGSRRPAAEAAASADEPPA